MSVASHLNIQIEEYDRRIRTFIPGYEDMLDTASRSLDTLGDRQLTIVDVGIGTGALTHRCLTSHSTADVVGIDMDPAMLALAQARLSHLTTCTFLTGDFTAIPLPACDALIASFALHHIMDRKSKQKFYAKCRRSIKAGGIIVSADCFTAKNSRVAAKFRDEWIEHLDQAYSHSESLSLLSSWAKEDRYFPLEDECQWLSRAGFEVEVVWRKGSFGVVVGC